MSSFTLNMLFDRGQISELKPDRGQKSFYGKAKISTVDGLRILKSYKTIVAYIDAAGTLHRVWYSWTATTGRHLVAFAGVNKAAWDRLTTEG